MQLCDLDLLCHVYTGIQNDMNMLMTLIRCNYCVPKHHTAGTGTILEEIN